MDGLIGRNGTETFIFLDQSYGFWFFCILKVHHLKNLAQKADLADGKQVVMMKAKKQDEMNLK